MAYNNLHDAPDNRTEQRGYASVRPAGGNRSTTPRQAQRRRASQERGEAEARSAQRRTGSAASAAEDARSQRRSGENAPAQRRDKFTKQQGAQLSAVRQWTTRICLGILVVGLVVGLAFFARPTTSEVEKRTLTQFPELTWDSFWNGDYFTQVSTWYADTYPLREVLVSWDKSLKNLFGIQTDTMMVGGTATSDELPSTEDEANANAAQDVEATAKKVVELPTEEVRAAEVEASFMNGLYVEGDAVYSVYYFSQEGVTDYASALNLAASKLDGQTKVYSILVPNNSGAMLPQSTLDILGGTDQQKATDYFNYLYSDKVTLVPILESLRSHNSEYLYFRSDHHWTQLGAYYAYRALCEQKGVTPHELSEYTQTLDLTPFLGSYYSELELAALENNPDTVHAYVPLGTNDMVYWDDDGNVVPYEVVKDITGWAPSSLYNCYIAGDKQMAEIDNPNITDGSTCLLVKDSFGCAFAPWLVDMYQTVYILDYRYTDQNIVTFCQEHGVQDLIFLNNISMAGTLTASSLLLSLIQ